MKDTPPGIERRFREMLLRRTAEERLKMGCSMHATAKALAEASILRRYPASDPARLRRRLFLHFYGADFAPEIRRRVASALSRNRQAAEAPKLGNPTTRKPPRARMSAVVKSSGAGAVREKGETYGATKRG